MLALRPALLAVVLATASACAQPSDRPEASYASASAAQALGGALFGDVGYDLARPAATVELPAALVEISGLAMLPDGRLAVVHDEDGIVYTIDAATGAIAAEARFAGPDDFEGVEATPDAWWVLESNGTLHEMPVGGGAAVEHDTHLKGRCDAEGLAWDAADGRLLVACKEEPGEGLGRVRAVYAFDVVSRTLGDAPVFQIAREAVDGAKNFKPSALAVHPTTGRIYVLSSVRPALAVLDRDRSLVALADLPADIFPQPEGLAFAPDGTLYVATEGDDGPARLARYAPTR